MSFEDSMIDEGFSDEQDYLDYLLDKEDERFENRREEENEEEQE